MMVYNTQFNSILNMLDEIYIIFIIVCFFIVISKLCYFWTNFQNAYNTSRLNSCKFGSKIPALRLNSRINKKIKKRKSDKLSSLFHSWLFFFNIILLF